MNYKKLTTIPETVAMLTLDGINIVSATTALRTAILIGKVKVYAIDEQFYVVYAEALTAVKGGGTNE